MITTVCETQIDRLRILPGDCVERMRELPPASVQLVVTSPPYDDLRTYGGHSWDFEATARELFRVLCDGGVARDLVLSWSDPGDTVLDPFGGSGTTAKAAIEQGRDALMIELSADYCALIERRCDVTPGLPLLPSVGRGQDSGPASYNPKTSSPLIAATADQKKNQKQILG